MKNKQTVLTLMLECKIKVSLIYLMLKFYLQLKWWRSTEKGNSGDTICSYQEVSTPEINYQAVY